MAARKADPTKIRIRDVAEVAGVSIATASNVLSGRRQVKSEAGRRVLSCAREMGYVRARGAATPFSPIERQIGYAQVQGAVMKKSIHFVIYKKHGRVVMDTPFFSELIAGIEFACRANGYTLRISYIDMSGDPNAQSQQRAALLEESSPVLLLATEMDAEDIRPFARMRVPLVVLDSLFLSEELNTVTIDNYAAGWIAGRHLTEKGHRHVGLITSSLPFNNMRDRRAGFVAALSEAGIAIKPEDVFLLEPTVEGSVADMLGILRGRLSSLPTACFATNDILAIGAYRALAEGGYRIPEDMSMVGMDNMPFCRFINPQLTTIDVPKGKIGEKAVQRLVEMAEQPDSLVIKSTIGVALIERNSVK